MEKYLTFPIDFIPRIIFDEDAFTDIFDYSIYKYYIEKCSTHDGDEITEMDEALDFLGITADIESKLIEGSKIYWKYKDLNRPHVSVNKSRIFEFRDEYKTKRQKELFALNLAIRSIIGTKGYVPSVSFSWMLTRMMGFNIPEDLGKNGKNVKGKELKELYNKYYPTENVKPSNCKNRRRRTKLLNETCEAWHIQKYSHKGFAFSIERGRKGISKKDLIYKVERSKIERHIKKDVEKEVAKEQRLKAEQDIRRELIQKMGSNDIF